MYLCTFHAGRRLLGRVGPPDVGRGQSMSQSCFVCQVCGGGYLRVHAELAGYRVGGYCLISQAHTPRHTKWPCQPWKVPFRAPRAGGAGFEIRLP